MSKSILTLLILLLSTGCYSVKQQIGAIQGTIVDAQSGEPLRGVLIERYEVAPERSKLVKSAPIEDSLSEADGEFALSSQHRIHFVSPMG
ncbi:MAG: hypothetical protein P1V97_17225 [Planctomycetota bacterium]|nr:hypothetical protein [Planctomycetota bacterium]